MGISETTGFAGNEVKWTDYYMSVHFLFEPDKQLTSDLAVGGLLDVSARIVAGSLSERRNP